MSLTIGNTYKIIVDGDKETKNYKLESIDNSEYKFKNESGETYTLYEDEVEYFIAGEKSEPEKPEKPETPPPAPAPSVGGRRRKTRRQKVKSGLAVKKTHKNKKSKNLPDTLGRTSKRE
jgi:hypothetical protein